MLKVRLTLSRRSRDSSQRHQTGFGRSDVSPGAVRRIGQCVRHLGRAHPASWVANVLLCLTCVWRTAQLLLMCWGQHHSAQFLYRFSSFVFKSGSRCSLIITITTNPTWPQIEAQLGPDQWSTDISMIVCWVFKSRLENVIAKMKLRFEAVVSVVRVIEFQKPGLHDAQIVLKVGSYQQLHSSLLDKAIEQLLMKTESFNQKSHLIWFTALFLLRLQWQKRTISYGTRFFATINIHTPMSWILAVILPLSRSRRPTFRFYVSGCVIFSVRN